MFPWFPVSYASWAHYIMRRTVAAPLNNWRALQREDVQRILSWSRNLPKHIIAAVRFEHIPLLRAACCGGVKWLISPFPTPWTHDLWRDDRDGSSRPFPLLQPANKTAFCARKCEQRQRKWLSSTFVSLVSLRSASQLLQHTNYCK